MKGVRENRRTEDPSLRGRKATVLVSLAVASIAAAGWLARDWIGGGSAPPPAEPAQEETAGAEPEEVVPAPPRPIPVSVEIHSEERVARLEAEGTSEGVPADGLVVVASELAFPDLRARLFDEGGRLVPSEDRAEIGQGSRYELRPKEPLVTGTVFRLVIDGQDGSTSFDVTSVGYLGGAWVFRTEGEKPPPDPSPRRRARR